MELGSLINGQKNGIMAAQINRTVRDHPVHKQNYGTHACPMGRLLMVLCMKRHFYISMLFGRRHLCRFCRTALWFRFMVGCAWNVRERGFYFAQ